MPKGVINDEVTFVKTVNASNSFREVAEKLGVTVSSVSTRYKKYKRLGIVMKDIVTRISRKLDADEINRKVAEAQ